MRKLLIPVDSSDNALRALGYALDLAKQIAQLEVCLVTAHEPALENARTIAYQPRDKIEQALREHSEDVLRPAVEMAKAAGVRFSSEVLIGVVPKVIVERAEALGCDGIVMGTRGMGAIGNLMLGSVATKVIHLTRLPVTLVK